MKRLALSAILLATAFAGCTNPGGDFTTFEEAEKDEFGNVIIKMTGALTFEPKKLKVPAGTTIVFENVGGGLHDADADNGAFKTALIGNGERSNTITLFQEGTIDYHCNPHLSNGMKGTIVVEAA